MYALAVVSTVGEREIIVTRHGPPLVIGLGEDEQFLASDPAALLAHTRDVIFLENLDVGRLTPDGVEIWDRDGNRVERQQMRLNWDPIQAEKGGYKHFMLKEIHEQPLAIQETFSGRVDFERARVTLDGLNLTEEQAKAIGKIDVLACGTSWHAGLVGKFLLQELAGIPVEVDYGSEYRYRDPIVDPSVMALGISQSGETADTLSALEAAAEKGARLYSICNVEGSQMSRLAEGVVYTHAGPEIGVASTKAFTTQLVAVYLLAIYLRQQRGHEVSPEMLQGLAHLPVAVDEVLQLEPQLDQLARKYHRADDFLYLGRGINYPIALEGALKLKEISYIHAEGYPAGEMKHGPIALIDEDLPIVAIATGERVYDKVRSNMQEAKARDGIVVALTDRDPSEFEGIADEVIQVPRVSEELQPIVNVVPLQLLAYHVGVRRGADVDQPRNLAKSVTVE
jgi:glucosamine--fructose-6-phosphate aminotransferase (isomerizing)